jgi:hypothetical protein
VSEGQAPGFTLKELGGFQVSRAGVSVKVPARKLACLLTYPALTAPAGWRTRPS